MCTRMARKMVKLSENLILAETRDGSFYIRRQRVDHKDVRKRSPATKYVQQRFKWAASKSKGKKGLVRYRGTDMPRAAAYVATHAVGRAPARHIDRKEINRQELRRAFQNLGRVVLEAFGEIVGVVAS